MYKHLWEPKRTAGDWGKTDYHIIRTWTPRLSQPNNQSHDARIQSNDSLPTLTHTRQKDNVAEDLQEEEEAVERISPFIQTKPNGTLSRDNNTVEHTQRLTGRKRPASSPSTENTAKRSRSLSTSVKSSIDGSVVVGQERDGINEQSHVLVSLQQSYISPVKRTILRSHETHHQLISSPPLHQLISSPPLHREERHSTVSEPARLGSEVNHESETSGVSLREAVESESEVDVEDLMIQPEKVARRKRKRAASKSSTFKVWQSHYERNSRDLNELDICFSLYDNAMRDAINEKDGNQVVQSALIKHWKTTKKHILSTIRDLSVISALEKRHRQELGKFKKLQQESLVALKTLRQVNGHYIQATSRAKSSKQAHKLSVEQSEVEELSKEISAYVTRLNSQY